MGHSAFALQDDHLFIQLAAWLQSVFDGLISNSLLSKWDAETVRGHAAFQRWNISRWPNDRCYGWFSVHLSSQPMCEESVSVCVCVCVCVKWMIWRVDTKLCLHLSLGLDAALKVKVQTLEPGSWLMWREQLAASRHTLHTVIEKVFVSVSDWICSLLGLYSSVCHIWNM